VIFHGVNGRKEKTNWGSRGLEDDDIKKKEKGNLAFETEGKRERQREGVIVNWYQGNGAGERRRSEHALATVEPVVSEDSWRQREIQV